jgi:excisionase family DNA binding protein
MWSNQKEIEWYLPVSVVADQLRCHSREVFELAEKGMIGFIRMPGNRIKISEESVRRFRNEVDQKLW